jgi:hypothetical protein
VATLGDELRCVVALSAPAVLRLVAGAYSSVSSTPARSARPLASSNSAFTMNPLRFSTSRFPL